MKHLGWTITLGAKGQLPVPVALCRTVGVRPGDKLDVFAVGCDTIRVTVRRPSRILDFAGELAHLDKEACL
jgi:bifunctional DNA-binding transcriptional regulator/antitoxin component of YhaV-PrlF toxin-antitoxin module